MRAQNNCPHPYERTDEGEVKEFCTLYFSMVRDGIQGGNMFSFEDYMDALKGAGPKLKEMVLERAEREGNLDFWEFKRLVDFAYPDPV